MPWSYGRLSVLVILWQRQATAGRYFVQKAAALPVQLAPILPRRRSQQEIRQSLAEKAGRKTAPNREDGLFRAILPDECSQATLKPPTRARTRRVEVSSAAHEESRSGRVRVAVPTLRG
jgi:hypothetical protein